MTNNALQNTTQNTKARVTRVISCALEGQPVRAPLGSMILYICMSDFQIINFLDFSCVCLSSSCVLCSPLFPVSLDCTFLIVPSVFPNIYLSPVLFVPNVSSVSGLSILDCPFGFLERLFKSCVLCTQCCQCLWIDHP